MTLPGAAELGKLVGEGAVRERPAEPRRGGAATLGVRPTEVEQVAAVMSLAHDRGWAVVVRGGGTKTAWGGPLQRCDLLLDTTGLDRLVEHEPGDLICVTGAGMTLGRLQTVIAAAPGHHQKLMLDPPQGAGVTLGGLVATRAAGPLRTRYGTMRDLLLGAQFVLADGTVARTGGKVVKNVAGYDLDKLLVGSLGGLAVVVEVAVRLHPVPESRRTVLLEDATPGDATQFLFDLRLAAAVPSVAEAIWPERTVLVQVDSSEEGAMRQAERVATLHRGARVLAAPEADQWERLIASRPWEKAGVVVGLAIPLAATGSLLSLAQRRRDQGVHFNLSLRGTLGVGEARLPADPRHLTQFREEIEAMGGHLDIHRASPPLDQMGSIPTDPVTRELMAAVKAALDPRGILAPGRLEWFQSGSPALLGAGRD